MDLTKRFSLPHFDDWRHPSLYYEAMTHSSQRFRDEICDIYFGRIFRHKYREQEIYDDHAKQHEVVYGNVMGVEASDQQVTSLLRLQQEFGLEISLTVNQLNIPVEIFYSRNDRVVIAFVRWLQDFYDRGVRSCTLANGHMMRAGVLQNAFPEMKWKNTVNQHVSSAQQVLDYLYLGYNVIQLDRSLNRNVDELKRIKDAVEGFKSKYPKTHVKTCLLVTEGCMPFCPFKREHDDLQIHHRKVAYRDSRVATLSCARWLGVLGSCTVPRSGTNCYWTSADTFREYAELVDVFKHSGRLRTDVPGEDSGRVRFGWSTGNHAVNSFSEILENGLEPVHIWLLGAGVFPDGDTDLGSVREALKDSPFMTPEARMLEQKLKNCRSQCYKCHLCERTFGLPDFDSLIEL